MSVLELLAASRAAKARQLALSDDVKDAWAARRGVDMALRRLRFGPVPAVMATPPALSVVNTTSTIATGETVGPNDRRLTYAGGAPQLGTGAPYNTTNYNRWITQPSGANKGEHDWSIRFVTDAPFFEVLLGDWNGASTVNIAVDGELISRRATISLPNASVLSFLKIDFGADVQGIYAVVAVAASGSGYALGDVLTVSGGTGAAMQLVVCGIDGSGGVTRVYVKSDGAYTVVPGNGAAVTGGAGTGATFNVTAGSPARSTHTTRRVRRIEIFGRGTKYGGVKKPPNSNIHPWPVSGPRLNVMCDSYGDTFTAGPMGGWPYRVAQRLGFEDVWVNGQGGTGFIANNGGALCTYRERLNDFVARMPANPATPAVFVTAASINDSAPADATLQAEVLAYWTQFFTTPAYEASFAAQIGMLRSSGSTPADSKHNAVKAGFLAAQAIYDPTGRRSAYIETRGTGYDVMTVGGYAGATNGNGNTDFYNAGDAAHPTPEGAWFIGDMLAAEILGAFQGWR